jgi:methylmalonyl-CoA/ethylmalonyl-CoA epimerase
VITKIHHVGVAVRSLEAALRFYRDRLGLPVTRLLTVPDQEVRVALLAAGESEVELLEPTAAETGVARFLARRGEGMHHLCFESDEVGRELRRLRPRGVRLIDEAPRKGAAGLIAFLHPEATAGVLIELATPLEHAGTLPSPCRLARVVIGVDEPRAAAQIYQDLFGVRIRTSEQGAIIQTTQGAAVVELCRAGSGITLGLSRLVLATEDRSMTERVRVAAASSPTESHGVSLALVESPDSP